MNVGVGVGLGVGVSVGMGLMVGVGVGLGVITCSWGIAQKAAGQADELLHKGLLRICWITQLICATLHHEQHAPTTILPTQRLPRSQWQRQKRRQCDSERHSVHAHTMDYAHCINVLLCA